VHRGAEQRKNEKKKEGIVFREKNVGEKANGPYEKNQVKKGKSGTGRKE